MKDEGDETGSGSETQAIVQETIRELDELLKVLRPGK